MDAHYLATVEFPKIIERLAEHCSFSAGVELAHALAPTGDRAIVAQRLQETTEAKVLLSMRTDVTIGGARDVRTLMIRAEREAFLQPFELLDVRATLISARRLARLFDRLAPSFPLLAEMASQLDPLTHIVDEIGRCIDEDGRILDGASPELGRIRSEQSIARDRLVGRLQRIVSSSANATVLQEALVTERNGRYVIPLKVEYKGRIPGIIHDQSSSGATLFIEPLETVELNNRWHELQLAEKREIERILFALAKMVGQDAWAIIVNVEVLAKLDLALAKGRYSFALKAIPAELVEATWPVFESDVQVPPYDHPLNLIQARHPLLDRDTVVPIDVYMGGNYTALLVTGPNTGGKTVTLKTVGLLAAMSQAGMHIPAADGSRLPVFDGIYVDIGDEQSIEQSLSTFSSHMTHIIDILEHADECSLVLLDELGAGTDPDEGAALAQALVNTLVSKKCLALCSTHYSRLKAYAYDTDWVENASVEFDLETLRPTFHLTVGVPGRSNALAIAGRLGLPGEIVSAARRLLAPTDAQTDALLANVKRASDDADAARLQAETGRQRVRDMENELRQKLTKIEDARRQVLDEAREEGRQELERLRQRIRRLDGAVFRPEVDRAAVAQVMQEIEELEREVEPLAPPVAPPKATSRALQVGDVVAVTTIGQQGEITALNGQEVEVSIGGFRLRTRYDALEFTSRPERKVAEPTRVGRPMVARPPSELDLRGWRAEQVAPSVDKYLDSAYLSGLPWVHIIHGKGMGVLKTVVRDFLQGHPLVKSFRPGVRGEGDDGVTVVTFVGQENGS